MTQAMQHEYGPTVQQRCVVFQGILIKLGFDKATATRGTSAHRLSLSLDVVELTALPKTRRPP